MDIEHEFKDNLGMFYWTKHMITLLALYDAARE